MSAGDDDKGERWIYLFHGVRGKFPGGAFGGRAGGEIVDSASY